jgi:hypothetical protein
MGMLQRHDWRDVAQDEIVHHLGQLRRDVLALSGSAGRYGSQLQHGAGELGEVLVHQGAAVARQLGRQAKRAGQAVQRDPVPTVVAVFGLACLLSLVLGRKAR